MRFNFKVSMNKNNVIPYYYKKDRQFSSNMANEWNRAKFVGQRYLSSATVALFIVSYTGPEPDIVHSHLPVFIWTLRLFTLFEIIAKNFCQSLPNNVTMSPPPMESPDHMCHTGLCPLNTPTVIFWTPRSHSDRSFYCRLPSGDLCVIIT